MKKTALVTGASSGIGHAIASDLIDNGWQVSLLSRNPKDTKTRHINPISCDISDAKDCAKAIDAHMECFGRLDLLVNAAGIATRSSIEVQTVDGWDLEMNTNVRGMFLLCQGFLDQIKQNSGLVVNIASISSFEGSKSMPAYSASKHAVLGLTRSLTKELADTGARATAICPGYVATPMTNYAQKNDVPADEMIQTSDIVEVVRMLLKLSPHAHLPEIEIRRV